MLVSLIAIAAFGGVIEALQPLFGRKAELQDLAANLSGEAIGFALLLVLRFVRKPQKQDADQAGEV